MIVQCKEEDVEKNGYSETDTQTNMYITDLASTLYWAG